MKTADEMFRELGFQKNLSECYSEKLGNLLYEKSAQNGTDIFELHFWGGRVVYQSTAHHSIWMHPPLIKAISKKLEEMEWEQAGSWRDARTDPPDNENEVLVCTRTKKGVRNVDKGYYFDEHWVHRGTSEVIHWMPLPELPEEEQ